MIATTYDIIIIIIIIDWSSVCMQVWRLRPET